MSLTKTLGADGWEVDLDPAGGQLARIATETFTVGSGGMYATVAEAVAAISALPQYTQIATPEGVPTTVSAWTQFASQMTVSGVTGAINSESLENLYFSVGAETTLYPVTGINQSGTTMYAAMRRIGATIAAGTALTWWRPIRYVVEMLDAGPYDEVVPLTTPVNIEFTSGVYSELAISLSATSAVTHGIISVSGKIRLSRGAATYRLFMSDANGWSPANFPQGNAVRVFFKGNEILGSSADFMSQYCVLGDFHADHVKTRYQSTTPSSHFLNLFASGDVVVQSMDIELDGSALPVLADFTLVDFFNARSLTVDNLNLLINDPSALIQHVNVVGTVVPHASAPMGGAAPCIYNLSRINISSLYSMTGLVAMAIVNEDQHAGATSVLSPMTVNISDVTISAGTIDITKFKLFRKNASAVPGSVFTPVISKCGALSTDAPTLGGVTCHDSRAAEAIAYAASITPKPGQYSTLIVGQLTGNISISGPAGTFVNGQELTLVYSADATPGRQITYNAIFKSSAVPASTANAKASHTFRWDGTNWVQIGGPLVWL